MTCAPNIPTMSLGHIELDSRAIESVGYHPPTRTLRVQFRAGGRTYEYANVPQSAFDSLMRADSRGRYFALHIRDRYASRVVAED